MTHSTDTTRPETGFELHRGRGPFNAAFFRVMGPYIELNLRSHKRRVFGELPQTVVEIGSGVGANLRYIPDGSTLVALEPNVHMHERLTAAALRHGVRLDLRERMAERTGIPDHSVDAIISSLVLCSVRDPAAVLAEIRRILKPGGTFRFVEHVVARRRTFTRLMQRIMRRPWGWTFEGCSCERDRAPPALRRVRERHRRALPNLHPVHPVQHAHRRHRPGLAPALWVRRR